MHTRSIFISQHDKALTAYFDRQTRLAKNLRNTANFIIRNLRTGLAKAQGARTENEVHVISMVRDGIDRYNAHLHVRTGKKISRIGRLQLPAMCKAVMVRAVYEKDKAEFVYPDKDHWMLSYEVLDAVLRETKNADYYAMPSQANQQVLRKVIKSWKGYFESLRSYKRNPSGFTGEPKQPGYTRVPGATATYTNQIIKTYVSKGRTYLLFPGCSLAVCIGAEAHEIVRAEAKPCHGGFRVYVTFDDSVKAPEVPEAPKRVLGIDPGIDNFLTCAANFQAAPFIIDGKWLKSANQGFNKSRARLLSELARGYDPKKAPKDSRRLSALSRKRDDQFRDFFYKAAHHITDFCAANHVEVIVYGRNRLQKQGIGLGARTNQNFTGIPYTRFFQILEHVAAKAGIPVIPTEESYTSMASLADGDAMPVYGDGGDVPEFSGRRVTRGQYRTGSGLVLNADVNGAANIIRKAYPDAFDGIVDHSYLAKTVERVTREQLCGCKRRKRQGMPKRAGMRPYLHHARMERKQAYMELFRVSSFKDKVSYIEAAKKAKAAMAA